MQEISRDTTVVAANGKTLPALTVFSAFCMWFFYHQFIGKKSIKMNLH